MKKVFTLLHQKQLTFLNKKYTQSVILRQSSFFPNKSGEKLEIDINLPQQSLPGRTYNIYLYEPPAIFVTETERERQRPAPLWAATLTTVVYSASQVQRKLKMKI